MSLQKLSNSTQPGSKYFAMLGKKTIGSSERARTQLQANTQGPRAVRLPAPAAIFWSLHGGSDGTFSPNVPREVKTRGSSLVFTSTARWTQPGTQRSGWIWRTYATGKAPVASLPSANTENHLRGQRRTTHGTFLKHCERQNHLP